MKKNLILFLAFFTCGFAKAQWSDPDASHSIHNINSGNVGIGTGATSPACLLHLMGTDVVEQKIQATSDGYAQLTFQANQKAWQWGKRPSYENDAMTLHYFDGAQWQNIPAMAIQPSGSVCIGTSNPGSFKLAVEGSIGARKVVVTLTNPFPDYVFDRDYKLLPLDSIAAYIGIHHHLPDMLPADSVEKAGLDLGSNQASLLQKIEELTLYLIQQNSESALRKEEAKRSALQVRRLEMEYQQLKSEKQLLEEQVKQLKGQEERISRLEHILAAQR